MFVCASCNFYDVKFFYLNFSLVLANRYFHITSENSYFLSSICGFGCKNFMSRC